MGASHRKCSLAIARRSPHSTHFLWRLPSTVPWYASWAKDAEVSRVGLRLVSSKISAHRGFSLIDDSTIVCHNSVVVIVPDASKIEPFPLLGMLNSQAFWRFLRLTTPYMGAGRQVLRLADIRRFPIPWPMTEDQRRLCSLIGDLVQKAMSTRDVDAVQDRIDGFVNEFFGLETPSNRWSDQKRR